MSDHLPECPGGVRPAKPANGNGPEIQYVIFGSGICICDRLRACEQRVLDATLHALYLMENMGGYPEFDFDHIRDDFRDVIDALKEGS